METIIVKEFDPSNTTKNFPAYVDLTPDGIEIALSSSQLRPDGTIRCGVTIQGKFSNPEKVAKEMEYAFNSVSNSSWTPDVNPVRVLYPIGDYYKIMFGI
jgi:hypothetical protein